MFSHARLKTALEQAVAVLPSGITTLDRLLPAGGFPRGRLSELSGGPSCGKRSIATALCAWTLQQGRAAAWIDGCGGFYPLPPLEQGASPLERLIVVRVAPDGRQSRCPSALRAADILVQAGDALALLIVDLPPPTGLPQRLLSRLRLGAETSGAAVVFITEQADAGSEVAAGRDAGQSLGSFICLRLCLRRRDPRRVEVTVVKSKMGQMAQRAVVTIDEPHSLCLDTTV